MIYIHFIINPISGSGKHNLSQSYLLKHFPSDKYLIEADYTNSKKHAIELTEKAIKQKPDYIIACGGDGTINEVASCMVGTDIVLGILPVGSGNGLASNLNIPRKIKRAIDIIKNGKTDCIDVGKINEHYFFSNTGVGIDALIIQKYENSGNRKLSSYIKAALSASFQYEAAPASISFDGKEINVNPFMLFISNSNEMGYKMSLTPKASLSDGLLDMVVIPELSFLEKMLLGTYVLGRSIEKFKKAEHYAVKNVKIKIPEKIFINTQIDGEIHAIKTNKINVSILPKSLKVLV
ncbi:diacylglycerol/lipid kinase family protein [Flavobacterium gelatinilyticum]|uniref:diacylglycerol/lipid kinase family protein n=1 Tax=Flavobacterium gelatinilyticum TaxID=3003260 RepID=UPI002480DD08|nr:diacylglycerol kinase family protein [Flavobacterium gelatinilyticum]